jgi:hypothetical protein
MVEGLALNPGIALVKLELCRESTVGWNLPALLAFLVRQNSRKTER